MQVRESWLLHISLTRYEDDSLHVHENERCAWLVYLREPADSGLYLDSGIVRADPDEYFRCDCGIDLQFPTRQTVSVLDALGIVRYFFREGALPTSWNWSG